MYVCISRVYLIDLIVLHVRINNNSALMSSDNKLDFFCFQAWLTSSRWTLSFWLVFGTGPGTGWGGPRRHAPAGRLGVVELEVLGGSRPGKRKSCPCTYIYMLVKGQEGVVDPGVLQLFANQTNGLKQEGGSWTSSLKGEIKHPVELVEMMKLQAKQG